MPRLIDLSFPLEDGQAGFPGDPSIDIATHCTYESKGYLTSRITLSSHHGTHVDAPLHFLPDGLPLDGLPLDQFYGPAKFIDLARGSALPPRTPMTVDMFRASAYAFLPASKVIFRTGWSNMAGRPEYFTDQPTLTVEAAEWLAERRIGLLGMDLPTPSTTDAARCHELLLGAGVVLVEGLTNLAQLPNHFTFVGLPLNLKGRDGSPVRAVAIVQ